jgi:phage pi2 protein 07
VKVLSLARKYGMEKKAKEYISQNKKIHYYNGGFVLYDPCNFLDKWKLRFEKLKNE